MIHETVQRYAAAVNAADPAMLERLFTEDAVLRNPFGTYTGTDEIMGFYRDVVLAVKRS